MARATFSFISTDFNKAEADAMQLLICVGTFSFSYMIVKKKQIEVLEKYNIPVTEDNLFRIFDQNDWLQQNFERVVIAHLTQYTTAIPFEHFNFNAKEVLDLMYDEDNESIKAFSDQVAPYQLHLAYRSSNEIVKRMIRSYPNNDSFHLQTLMLPSTKNETDTRIVVAVIDHTFSIQIFNNGKLLLTKTIVCDSNQSFLYNILAFAKMHNLNPNEVPLSFVGWITADAALYNDTKKYFSNIDVIEENSFKWDNELIKSQYVALYHFLFAAK